MNLPVRSDYVYVKFKHGVQGKPISCFGTGLDGAVVTSSPIGLVITEFASQYRLKPRAIFKVSVGRCKATTPSALSTTNKVTIPTHGRRQTGKISEMREL